MQFSHYIFAIVFLMINTNGFAEEKYIDRVTHSQSQPLFCKIPSDKKASARPTCPAPITTESVTTLIKSKSET